MSFEITKEILQEAQIYGQLQYLLMESTQTMMAIALLKEKAFTKGKRQTQLSEAGSRLKGLLEAHFLKTMDDLYSYSYLMMNPSFMTQLKIGDKVLVLGSLHKRSEKRVMSVKMKEGK